MTETPPQEPGLKIFRRLLGFLKPYKVGAIISLVLAAVAMGMAILIPYL
ncbi:MAG: hypothetical protein H0V85_04605, partial [Thermoleophilaceae bacterium]|nr:hypothetical protein [Thermoleophilaceae bacterium]